MLVFCHSVSSKVRKISQCESNVDQHLSGCSCSQAMVRASCLRPKGSSENAVVATASSQAADGQMSQCLPAQDSTWGSFTSQGVTHSPVSLCCFWKNPCALQLSAGECSQSLRKSLRDIPAGGWASSRPLRFHGSPPTVRESCPNSALTCSQERPCTELHSLVADHLSNRRCAH
jgi:hypothetical protein